MTQPADNVDPFTPSKPDEVIPPATGGAAGAAQAGAPSTFPWLGLGLVGIGIATLAGLAGALWRAVKGG